MGVKGGCKGFSMFRQHGERAHNSGGSYIFGWFRRSFRGGLLPTCLPVVCSAGHSLLSTHLEKSLRLRSQQTPLLMMPGLP